MKIISLCGVTCVGKTTYAEKLVTEYVDSKRPVCLNIGLFFRNTLGPRFFEELDNPTAPTVTEHWVRNMVHNAIELSYNSQRDVILDGFPRTKDQFYWLIHSSFASSRTISVELKFCFVDEDIMRERMESRIRQNPEEEVLLLRRNQKDVALLKDVYSEARRVLDSRSKGHDGLSLTEVNL